ncbi:MAG: MerR family transcriptional regulator [Desulfobulbaceae bacterium]|nr:MerR family transcriptional regulator [Desulfobulbaceae bacterium]
MESKDQRFLPDKQYFKIGEASELIGVDPHVLRYWEAEFKIIKPLRAGSRQRLYRRHDLENLLRIRELLYDKGYTIAGARQAMKVVVPAATAETNKAEGAIPREFVGSLKQELYELMKLLED